jgi:hypothetical protein
MLVIIGIGIFGVVAMLIAIPTEFGELAGSVSDLGKTLAAVLAAVSGKPPQTSVSSSAVTMSQRAEVARQRSVDSMFPGTVRPIVGHAWPCAPNASDLPRLIRIIESLDDENTPDTMVNVYANALLRAKAISLGSRNSLNIIKTIPGFRLVKVLNTKPQAYVYQRETAESCWITAATIGAER